MEGIGVGVAGFWHVHANDYARQVVDHPRTQLVAGWDRDAKLAEDGAATLGLPLVDDLDTLLALPEVDAVTVTTATSDHVDVIRRALQAGKHVYTEKLLAPSVAECEALIKEAEAQGVQLVVSLPRLSEPATVAASRLIAEGELGRVTYARVRMAHDGWLGGWLPDRFADPSTAVGGAFTDLGCHPAYLVQRFLGSAPSTVSASYGDVTGHGVEDNAVVVARYADGAIGVAEASFVTTPGASAFEVRGTEATLLHGFGGEELIGKGGRFGDAWTRVELPDAQPHPFQLWVDAIQGRADGSENRAAAVELTRLVVAANEAADTGRTIEYDAR
ncbi:Gfo/Idh/MocA family protein [Isoptericola sp. NPDC056618]|uniref:Gfo/Idh/MocA family protein n=1 Tax=Isoptericola sp. NPDC056618 TaxID=3345878 RepID=UPI003676B92F